jgi:hypothetical protein
MKKNNFIKARQIMQQAEARATSLKVSMSRLEGYFLHERIGECLEDPMARKKS